ncbi:MAG TPA: outer membrane protein assembly factor BamA [Kofleriaceae bacterium]|nr:outer membrane protein assembly factor BamA [Kofleriaceae bacterium]
MKRSLVAILSCAIGAGSVALAQPQKAPAQKAPAPAPKTPAPTPGPAPAQPAAPAAPTPAAPSPTPAPTPAPPPGIAPEMQGRPVERVQFRGNRKVEDDAIRVQLLSKPGTLYDATKLREDIRAMWKMGFFADVSVEAEVNPSGGLTLTFAVKEKPSIRKVLVAGNQELGLEKINEVIDLELDTIVDIAKVKKNREKIADQYVQKGFYLATVDYEIKPINEAEVDVWFKVNEKAKVKIRDVQFIGNHSIADDELRLAIQTRRQDALSFLNDSGVYSQEAFERDLLLVSAHYWDKGFANVKVGTPQLRLSRDKEYMYLSIPIDEGPIFTIGAVNFKGDLIGTASDNLNKIRMRAGNKFSRTVIAEDREKISAYYQDQGYAYANVSPLTKVDLPTRKITLTYEVSRGKRAYFERINIRGNSKTRDKVIRREMKIAEGELFNNTNLETSKRRITALGFFENVVVSTKRGSSDEFVEVNVEVTERPTGTFQIGAGFSSVENFIAQAQISQNNLFGRGQTLALQAQLSSLRQLFLLRFVEPWFLDTEWRFSFDLYNQSRGFGTFYRNASGGMLTWGYPLSYEAAAFVTYKLEDVSITTGSGGFANLGATSAPIAATSVANLFRGGTTSSLRASLQWDSRNNRLFPTGGWYETVFAEYASQYTGSENKFVRWGGFVRHYRQLWGPFVLHLNGELGITTSTDPLGVPISERYLVGGIYDIRGYAPRSLGPQLKTQPPGDLGQSLGLLPLGGNLQVIFNSEIEFPLFKKVGISGVVFFDMGNAYNLEDRYCSGRQQENSTISIKFDPCFRPLESLTTGLRKSVGFGFRWFSPIGPLRFEWGIPLDAQNNAQIHEDPLVFEFTIGNFF